MTAATFAPYHLTPYNTLCFGHPLCFRDPSRATLQEHPLTRLRAHHTWGWDAVTGSLYEHPGWGRGHDRTKHTDGVWEFHGDHAYLICRGQSLQDADRKLRPHIERLEAEDH
jgi:hypothetical protein